MFQLKGRLFFSLIFFRPKFLFFLCFFLLIHCTTYSQSLFTISGTVKDISSGETLIGATVKIKETKQNGTITNAYGFFSVTAPAGNYTLVISYIGYEIINRQVSLNKNTDVIVQLNKAGSLKEVVINGNSAKDENVKDPQMGMQRLDMSQVSNIPVFLGEKDILKTIQLLPGVKSSGDGNTGFYVRGGNSDQNLILLDEAVLYNASHLFGFFSTFNSDAIKDVELYKGTMSAQYGGRLSSVLDIKMIDGNDKNYTIQGGIGLISSRLKVEGPLVKNKGSFMISARRTYADLFLKLSPDSTINGTSLYFYDINAKANYHFDDKNAIYLSGYFGKDVLGLKNIFGSNWGNNTGTLRFNHIFNNKLFSNTSIIYSKYDYTIQSLNTGDDFKVVSKIQDINLKEDLQYFFNDRHTLFFGFNTTHHTIAPGDITTSATSSFNSKHIEDRYGLESAAYISDEWQATHRLKLLYGIRLAAFSLFGPGSFKDYDANGNAISQSVYSSGQHVKNYLNMEPRASASYSINDQTSVKASFNRNTQNIHLLSNSTSTTPTDLYVMSSNNIKPEIADQLSLGYYKNFKDNLFEFSAEVYHKWLQNQIDYKNGAQLIANADVESQLVYGTGRAYGLELFLKKKYGRFNGWIGYTLSRTEQRFNAINNGNYFPARQDRTHDASLVGIYKLTSRWTISNTFVYGTGNAITYPSGKYMVGGLTTYYYSERNGYRMPPYSRLDIGATLEGREHKKYHSSWTFGVYNVYNRKNPYIITFRDNKDDPSRTEAVKTSLFGAIPSITYNFKF